MNEKPNRLRFGVKDVNQVKIRLEEEMGLMVEDKLHTPNVVLLYNIEDPWGYKLGVFQDLLKYPLD